jgi:hypothetical protein
LDVLRSFGFPGVEDIAHNLSYFNELEEGTSISFIVILFCTCSDFFVQDFSLFFEFWNDSYYLGTKVDRRVSLETSQKIYKGVDFAEFLRTSNLLAKLEASAQKS